MQPRLPTLVANLPRSGDPRRRRWIEVSPTENISELAGSANEWIRDRCVSSRRDLTQASEEDPASSTWPSLSVRTFSSPGCSSVPIVGES